MMYLSKTTTIDAGENASYYVRKEDKPLPLSVCAAVLVTVSVGCWAVIIYVASLI